MGLFTIQGVVSKYQSPMAIYIEGRLIPGITFTSLSVTLSRKPLYCSHREYVCRYLNFNNNFNMIHPSLTCFFNIFIGIKLGL